MFWIIEPHADDAFLSLHAHLTTLWSAHARTIVTLFTDEERAEETAAYARAIGCRHMTLGLPDGRWGKPAMIPPLDDWLPQGHGDVLICPLGLRHPDHIAAAHMPATWRYVDAPYGTRQDTATELLDKIRGLRIVSLLHASEDKRYYLAMFPSQFQRFALSPSEFPPRTELVVCTS